MVGDGGWTTAINAGGQVESTPPPHLDTGQTRANDYHHPERLLRPPDESEPEREHDTVEAVPTQSDRRMAAAAHRNRSTPWATMTPVEPGGPAPPDDQAA